MELQEVATNGLLSTVHTLDINPWILMSARHVIPEDVYGAVPIKMSPHPHVKAAWQIHRPYCGIGFVTDSPTRTLEQPFLTPGITTIYNIKASGVEPVVTQVEQLASQNLHNFAQDGTHDVWRIAVIDPEVDNSEIRCHDTCFRISKCEWQTNATVDSAAEYDASGQLIWGGFSIGFHEPVGGIKHLTYTLKPEGGVLRIADEYVVEGGEFVAFGRDHPFRKKVDYPSIIKPGSHFETSAMLCVDGEERCFSKTLPTNVSIKKELDFIRRNITEGLPRN